MKPAIAHVLGSVKCNCWSENSIACVSEFSVELHTWSSIKMDGHIIHSML